MASEAQQNNLTKPMVEVVDVHKSFGDLEVLKGISLSVRKGEGS